MPFLMPPRYLPAGRKAKAEALSICGRELVAIFTRNTGLGGSLGLLHFMVDHILMQPTTYSIPENCIVFYRPCTLSRHYRVQISRPECKGTEVVCVREPTKVSREIYATYEQLLGDAPFQAIL